MQAPILITGAARSGTSLVAGIVYKCGAFGGKMSGATRHNKKGMFENSALRNRLVKPYFASIGADKMGQKPLPSLARVHDSVKRGGAAAWRNAVEQTLGSQHYADGPWFYKGAKMCLMWPLWHAAFPEAKWIIVRREDAGIVASCLRTGFMRAYQDAAGWQRWVDYHKARFEEMIRAGLDIRSVWSEEIIKGDHSGIHGAVQWARLDWNEAAVADFVSPELFHGARA